MSEFFRSLDATLKYLHEFWAIFLAILVVVVAATAYFRSRKQILFESWINMHDSQDSDLGRSVADLLLFKIRFIKSVHERSAGALGSWNVYREVPSFRQGLDDDVKLLGSVELGKYGSIVSGILMVFLRIMPIMFRPSRLKGSIHKYGERLQLLASLEFRHRKGRGSDVRLWEVIQEQSSPELTPNAVEQLAFRIYLDLTGEELFKSWEGFQAYTTGLASYLSYVDLQREVDYQKARESYEKALALEPNNPAVKYSLGVLEYYRFDAEANERAMAYFSGALGSSVARLRSYAHSGLATALLQRYARFNIRNLKFLEDAVYHSQRAIDIDPDLDVANKALGFACHQLGDYQAESQNPALRKLYPGNREKAIKHYKKAYELNKENFSAHNNLANLYLEWGVREQVDNKPNEALLKKAIQECEATLAISPQYHMAHDNLGNTYYALGQFDKAGECFKTALRYKADYPEAMNDLAVLHLEKEFSGRSVSDALRYHEQSLHFLPNSEQQRKKLCRLFGERWDMAQGNADVQLGTGMRQQLAESHCTCVAERLVKMVPAS